MGKRKEQWQVKKKTTLGGKAAAKLGESKPKVSKRRKKPK